MISQDNIEKFAQEIKEDSNLLYVKTVKLFFIESKEDFLFKTFSSISVKQIIDEAIQKNFDSAIEKKDVNDVREATDLFKDNIKTRVFNALLRSSTVEVSELQKYNDSLSIIKKPVEEKVEEDSVDEVDEAEEVAYGESSTGVSVDYSNSY